MHKNNNYKSNLGFTLVELSIVLVIVGLLIGGILVGQTLINSAKINAQIQQVQQYGIIEGNFRAKFKCIPGDCTIFYSSPGCASNGNGILEGVGLANNMFLCERHYYFQHMYNSGLLKEKYTDCYATTACIGVSYPKIKTGSGAIGVIADGNQKVYYSLAISNDPASVSGSNFGFFGMSTTGILSPEQSAAIDNKMDDGKPNTGNVVVTTSTPTYLANFLPYPLTLDNAANGCTLNGASYNAADPSTTLCRLLIKAQIY